MMRGWRREIFASGSSSSRSTSGKMPLSASHRPMLVSIPVIENSRPTRPPRSINRRAVTRELSTGAGGESDSIASVRPRDESAKVDDGAFAPGFGRLGSAGLILKAERSSVTLRRLLELPSAGRSSGLRSRAGMAGLGILVEVVNDGGAIGGPSLVLDGTGSLSTALGGL